MCFLLTSKPLLIALISLLQSSFSKNICQWNRRKIVSTSGYYKLTTLRPSSYSDGFVNGRRFKVTQSFFLFGTRSCNIDRISFPCYNDKLYDVDITTLEFQNITGVDTVVINSTFPITAHRVKGPARSTKIPRFHLVESTEFNYCPKWDRLNLTWTLIGDLNTTEALTCFENKTKLCQGTTTDLNEGSEKCMVSEGSGQVKFTLTVSKQNSTGLSFYYCQLNATAGEIVTYVVDWRDSSPIPEGGIPPATHATPPTSLPLLTCKRGQKRRGTV